VSVGGKRRRKVKKSEKRKRKKNVRTCVDGKG
jgi:hypothetical protein